MAQVMDRRTLAAAIAGVLACIGPAGVACAQDAVPYQPALDAAWAGRTGEGLRLLDAWLSMHPDDHAARLDRARFLAWRGDYAAAMDTLAAFPADDAEANALRARVLGWAERRHAALAANAPLYQAVPGDYDNAWTQALIQRQGEWPQQALPALATVEAVKPDQNDTRDLARAVRVPLFSTVSAPISGYQDSDDIEIHGYGLDANLWLGDQWRLLAGATRREYSARLGGPFAPPGGDDSVDEDRYGLGARLGLSPDLALELWLGRSELDYTGFPDDGATIGHLALSQYVNDAFAYTVSLERDRAQESPRALSVLYNDLTFDARWRAGLRDTIAARVEGRDYSDDNRRAALLATWGHDTWHGDKASLTLGAQVEAQTNSRNTDRGYYSPDHYVRIAPMASSYVGFTQDVGLYLSAALGMQRDETFDNWKRAFDANAELTIGIYSRWQLVARAGYSQRLNQLGQYEGTSAGLELRYRFCDYRADRCPRAD